MAGDQADGVGESTGGSEPDYRFTLANERTFLAWVRTGLAVLAGSVAVMQVSRSPRSWPAEVLAGGLALAGAAIAWIAYARWARFQQAMRHGKALELGAAARWMLTIVTALAAFLVALTVLDELVTGKLGRQYERTALAWERTALAGAAWAVLALRGGFEQGSLLLGGAGCALLGFATWAHIVARSRRPGLSPRRQAPFGTERGPTVAAALLAGAAAVVFARCLTSL